MNQLQLYLNNQLIDLSDDSPIALSFQINNLAEVKNQQGNTSNQFKLPLTQRNRQILGYPDEVAFTNCLPYTQYAAKIVQDGLEIIPYGIGELNSIDQDTANITVVSGNVDFFDNLEGKIYDMGDQTSTWYAQAKQLPWQFYDHAWTLDNVVRSQTHNWTDGWVWPVVDYGKIDSPFTDTSQIDIRYLRPGFYLRKAVELMVGATGYRINPDSFLVKEELYSRLIVQFSNDNFEHGTDYQNNYAGQNIQVQSTTDQKITYGSARNASFPNIIADAGSSFDTTNNFYSVHADAELDIELDYSLHYFSVKNNGQVTISIRVYDPGIINPADLANNTYDSSNITPVKTFGLKTYNQDYNNVKLTYSGNFTKGQLICINYDLSDSNTTGMLRSGAVFSVTEKKGPVIVGQQVQCERIFPDISQKDLLKDTLQRFGIICQTDNTTRMVTLASLRDIVNNIPRALDWSRKVLNQGKTISFQLGGYAQVNNLKYKQDDNVLPNTLADAQIVVDDKTLPATSDLLTSQFAPTLNRTFTGQTIAQILKVDTSGDASATDFSISTQPRILVSDYTDLLALNKSVVFTDGANSQAVNDKICTPYFDKPGGRFSLLFDKLRLAYYPELEKVLKRSKKVIRYFLLTPRDILELDLLIPVYVQQDSAYYYINKIDSWRKGQPTKAELIKLS